MSCGNPHATPCAEVRALVYVYLDGEVDEVHRLEVVTHLGECPPCETIFVREQVIKQRVRTACAPQAAPDELRTRIVTSIREVSVEFRLES